MADRLDAIGGSISVRSAPGEGTSVTGTVPVVEGPVRRTVIWFGVALGAALVVSALGLGVLNGTFSEDPSTLLSVVSVASYAGSARSLRPACRRTRSAGSCS
jgi:hypothetical protein